MDTVIHLICTSSGNQSFPSVLRALADDESVVVTATDSDPLAPGLLLAPQAKVVSPRSHAKALLQDLEQLVDPTRRNVVLPLSTDDQTFFAEHKNYLENLGITVIVAEREPLQVAGDKHRLMQHARDNGFDVPHFEIHRSARELCEGIARFGDQGLACVMKRAHGTGFQGVKILDPKIDISRSFWDRDKTRIHPSDAIAWFERHDITDAIMLTDFLPGEHISVDAIKTNEHKFFGAARVELRHMYGSAVIGRTIDDSEVVSSTRRLVDSVGLAGAMNVEYKRDRSGVPRLLEINPRFGASVGHTVASGMNLPKALVYSAVGRDIELGTPQPDTWFAATWQNVLQ